MLREFQKSSAIFVDVSVMLLFVQIRLTLVLNIKWDQQ